MFWSHVVSGGGFGMMEPRGWEAGVDRCPSNLPVNGHVVRRVEVLAGPERRRRWSWEEKARIVAESLAPDAVASAVARRYGLHPNQLYAWRKALRAAAEEGARAGAGPLDFVPVVMTDEAAAARRTAIEIEAAGVRVRVLPGVDSALLADVLRTLKALG
jgi:transposase